MITHATLLNLIDTFYFEWNRLKNPVDNHEKKRLLKLLAKNVKQLCKAFSKSHYSQKFLFEYLLDTIWGAPFVYEMSLKEASNDIHHFKELINHMLEHSQVIDKEINVAREQIVNNFSKKKSA